MAAAKKTPLPGSRHANAPQRNGDPVSAAIASRYSANAAPTGRRTRLPVPRQRACGQAQRFKAMLSSVAGKPEEPVRTHAAPLTPGRPRGLPAGRSPVKLASVLQYPPGALAPCYPRAARRAHKVVPLSCSAGSAIGEATVMGDANAAPHPWPAAEPCGSAPEWPALRAGHRINIA